jgi:hypothetical protein
MPFDNENYRPIPEGHRRLLVLAEFLETRVDPKRFDLAEWSADDFLPTPDCGTAACACGWAGMLPEFNALGFRLVLVPTHEGSDEKAVAPTYKDAAAGWASVQTFFELSYSQTYSLFEMYHYRRPPGPQQVAARIRKLVAKEQSASMQAEVGAVASRS